MKAFLSYSHKDEPYLEKLHIHLAQLKREGLITCWTDEAILAGGHLDTGISSNLANSQLFVALLSPDYIASNYCYEKEFIYAQKMHDEGSLIIVPIILEPCEWQQTPFAAFKALPKDGKPISDFQNPNTAFLGVTKSIRALLETSDSTSDGIAAHLDESTPAPAFRSDRNYKIKKDFDSIHKLEFLETSFADLKNLINSYLNEITQVDEHIKFRITKDDDENFECFLVNRNKIQAECQLKLCTQRQQHINFSMNEDGGILAQFISSNKGNNECYFQLLADDYHMFWSQGGIAQFYQRSIAELTVKGLAEEIWDNWLENVGIV